VAERSRWDEDVLVAVNLGLSLFCLFVLSPLVSGWVASSYAALGISEGLVFALQGVIFGLPLLWFFRSLLRYVGR